MIFGYLFREEFINDSVRLVVDRVIIMRLKMLNLVQASTFFNDTGNFVQLPNLISTLKYNTGN